MAGQNVTGWLCQSCLDNFSLVSKKNVHSAFCSGKVLDSLKSLAQSAANLFIVCPHPLISS